MEVSSALVGGHSDSTVLDLRAVSLRLTARSFFRSPLAYKLNSRACSQPSLSRQYTIHYSSEQSAILLKRLYCSRAVVIVLGVLLRDPVDLSGQTVLDVHDALPSLPQERPPFRVAYPRTAERYQCRNF